MTYTASLGCRNVSSNALLGVSTVGPGALSATIARHAIEPFRDLDRWRLSPGEGSMAMSVAGRIPIRTRVAHQRVLDEFAVIAKKCRKRRCLSIDAVAQQSQIPPKRIQQFERGAVAPSEPEIVRLSAVYGVGASVITRRLKRVFDQFAGFDGLAIENIVRLKWNNLRIAEAVHGSMQGVGVASECHGARDGENHKLSNIDWPAFRPTTLGESILAECMQLLTLTTFIQALVAQEGTPVLLQAVGNFSQPASAVTKANLIKMMKSHAMLALVCSNLSGIVDRLEKLALRRRAKEGAQMDGRAQELGDVLPFPDQEIHAECARIADAKKLIAQFRICPPLPMYDAHSGAHAQVDRVGSPGARQASHAEHSVSMLNCAIDLLSEAAYQLFDLSGHCT